MIIIIVAFVYIISQQSKRKNYGFAMSSVFILSLKNLEGVPAAIAYIPNEMIMNSG